MVLEFEQMIENCIAKCLEINLKDRKLLQKQEKKYFKRQEIITKCLKFEGIGGKVQENQKERT